MYTLARLLCRSSLIRRVWSLPTHCKWEIPFPLGTERKIKQLQMDCQNITILYLYDFSFVKDKLMEPESGFRVGHFQEVCDISISLLLKSKYCAKICFSYILTG